MAVVNALRRPCSTAMARPIHQLVHTLSYGDAISTEVLALERALREAGRESSIYALHEHPNLRGRSRPFSEMESVEGADLILHYSIGSPLNDLYLNWQRGRRLVIYHNITPAKWFRGVNARVARDIERGFDELPKIIAVSDLRIADSEFNASELEGMGYSSIVLDLPVDPSRWDRPRNEGIYSIVSQSPGIHVLHVGRLAPNKCIEDILKTFHFLQHYIDRNSTLWLVGIDTDTELYSFSLRRLAAELSIDQSVRFVGCLSDEEVRSLYESCSVYLCMSEHEGFCLPLIEAMHFGLPVIAFGSGAVPATVGTGGIVVTEKRHAELAELVGEVSRNVQLRAALKGHGKKRVEQLSYHAFAEKVRVILGELETPSQSQRFA